MGLFDEAPTFVSGGTTTTPQVKPAAKATGLFSDAPTFANQSSYTPKVAQTTQYPSLVANKGTLDQYVKKALTPTAAPPTNTTGILSGLGRLASGAAQSLLATHTNSMLDTQKQLTQPKPQGMEFPTAPNALALSDAISQRDAAGRQALGGNSMDAQKSFLDLIRAPVRGLVGITNPNKTIDPLYQGQLARFIYGDEPIVGYSRQAASTEQSLKDQGFGKLSTPLAVIGATGTAALDLDPFYAPIVSSINDELASAAEKTGTRQIKITYKDLQDISSGKVTNGEKFDALKTVGKDVPSLTEAIKGGGLPVDVSEDSLLKRATGPIQDVAKPIDTTYSLPQQNPAIPQPISLLQARQQAEASGQVIETPKPLDSTPVEPKIAPTETIKPKVIDTPSKENPLATEAKKYPTADEFVNKYLSKPELIPVSEGYNESVATQKAMLEKADKVLGEYRSIEKFARSPKGQAMPEIKKAQLFSKYRDLVGERETLLSQATKMKHPETLVKTHIGEKALKSQLEEIYNQAQGSAKTTTEPIEPVVEAKTPSKIAKSIEQKAIDTGITDRLSSLAGYDKITIDDQKARAEELFSNIDEARAVLRGEKPLPEGLRGTSVIIAAESYLKVHPDPVLVHELANSPYVSATSYGAQEMRLAAEREPDSLSAKLQELKTKLTKNAGGDKEVSVRKTASIKDANKVLLPKEDLSWNKFLENIKC